VLQATAALQHHKRDQVLLATAALLHLKLVRVLLPTARHIHPVATTIVHVVEAITVVAITAVEETLVATTRAIKTNVPTLLQDVQKTGTIMITPAPISQVHRLTEAATRGQAPSLLETETTALVEITAMATLVLVVATTVLAAT
jgi:hypothetical protein